MYVHYLLWLGDPRETKHQENVASQVVMESA